MGADELPGDAVVTADAAEAASLVAAGIHVVAIIGPGRSAPQVGGPGRLAVLVGDAGDSSVLAAAEEMAAELFGGVERRRAKAGP